MRMCCTPTLLACARMPRKFLLRETTLPFESLMVITCPPKSFDEFHDIRVPAVRVPIQRIVLVRRVVVINGDYAHCAKFDHRTGAFRIAYQGAYRRRFVVMDF